MDIYFYNKQEYPKPIGKDGEFSDEPYSITVPNSGHLDNLGKYFKIYDSEKIAYAVGTKPVYPKLVNGCVVESTIEDYKLAGLIPLESFERISSGAVVYTAAYKKQILAEEVAVAKTSKVLEMEVYKTELLNTRVVDFTFGGETYNHGISKEDNNSITATITTLGEVAVLLGHSDTTVTWKFKNAKFAVMKKPDVVQLSIAVQTVISGIFHSCSIVVEELAALTTVEEINAYDVKSKFE